MTINVLVNGAFGRMGQVARTAITNDPKLILVGETTRGYNLVRAIFDSKAQVVIDFTNAKSVYENACTIIETNAHPLIGTSGLTNEQILELQKKCAEKKLGGLIVPNFSIGAVLMMKYAAEISKYMLEVEIIESHHPDKMDSPSGTSMRTAELIAQVKKTHHLDKEHEKTQTIKGARGAIHHNIPIHSIRATGLLAKQQVLFGGNGETLMIEHNTINRECFMPGITLACEKVMNLHKLMVGLESVL